MGYDLYGLNPVSNNKPDEPDFMNDKEGSKAYFTWQSETKGAYFRANVWFWRPIWSFVCGACHDILSEKDMEAGCSNSGEKVSKTKSVRIASRLKRLDKNGVVQIWEDDMMESYNKAKKHNDEIQEVLDAITKSCKEEHGNDVVPMNYPAPYKALWNDAYDKKDWGANYPPSRKYIMEFAIFSKHSGGFEIC